MVTRTDITKVTVTKVVTKVTGTKVVTNTTETKGVTKVTETKEVIKVIVTKVTETKEVTKETAVLLETFGLRVRSSSITPQGTHLQHQIKCNVNRMGMDKEIQVINHKIFYIYKIFMVSLVSARVCSY